MKFFKTSNPQGFKNLEGLPLRFVNIGIAITIIFITFSRNLVHI